MKHLLFHKIALKHIIAPHGMTDIIHAIEYKNVPNLVWTYSTCGFTTYTLHHFPQIIDVCFLFFSILHFRTDMPQWGVENKWNAYIIQTIQSSCLVFWFLLGKSYKLFLYFMCFLHVPKHYKDSYTYLKKYPFLTIALFSIFELMFPNDLYITRNLLTMFESIITGHILYHELFVRE